MAALSTFWYSLKLTSQLSKIGLQTIVPAPEIRSVLPVALACSAASAFALLFAAVHSNSSAFLAAAIGSLVATASHALLLHGLNSAGPADAPTSKSRPARDLYFWAFVVAMLLFSLGAGLAIYEGTGALTRSYLIEGGRMAYVLGGLALTLTGWSLQLSLAGLTAMNDALSVRPSDDPGLFALILQGMAALTATVLAVVGLFAASYLEMTRADGLSAVAIGLVLATVAAVLAIETKKILADGAPASPTPQGNLQVEHVDERHVAPYTLITVDTGIRALSAAMSRALSPGVIATHTPKLPEAEHPSDKPQRLSTSIDVTT